MGMTGLFVLLIAAAVIALVLIGWFSVRSTLKLRRQDEEDRLTFRDWPL